MRSWLSWKHWKHIKIPTRRWVSLSVLLLEKQYGPAEEIQDLWDLIGKHVDLSFDISFPSMKRKGFYMLKQGGKELRLTLLFKWTWSYLELSTFQDFLGHSGRGWDPVVENYMFNNFAKHTGVAVSVWVRISNVLENTKPMSKQIHIWKLTDEIGPCWRTGNWWATGENGQRPYCWKEAGAEEEAKGRVNCIFFLWENLNWRYSSGIKQK